MKLYYKYIATLFLMLAASGCALDEFGLDPVRKQSSDAVTVLGRITSFEDHDVDTRDVKEDAEKVLNSMALAIFPVKEDGSGLDDDCVYYQYSDSQTQLLFSIERGSTYKKNARYAMYIFTNMPGMGQFKAGDKLEDMMKVAYDVESNLNIPENGFPMMGSLGDTFSTTFDRDGQEFILSPTDDSGELTTPTVDGVDKDILHITMRAMYAKVHFTIEVRPDQSIEGGFTPQFELKNYKVYNIPSKVDFSNETDSDTEVIEEGFTREVTGYTIAKGANKIHFWFYVPERLLTPATKSHDGTKHGQDGYYSYPFPIVDGKYRSEDLTHRQRHKSQLLGTGQKATNIQISGTFVDHQHHSWDVTYTIYLGEDNYGDFNIRRNYEYYNEISIRGIQSSSDASDNDNAISIDHRVNVRRTQPAIISLRRETLLDSHFEVRPLRVRSSEADYSESGINAVKVEVVDPETTDWMRLERSFGDGTPEESPQTTVNGVPTSIYIDNDSNGASYGKRKFFTYNLIDGVNANATDASLVNSTSVILPLRYADECCWIYIDECTEVGDEVRSGIVKVSYGSYDGTTFTPADNPTYPDVDYIISQRKLFQVKYDDPETPDEDENRIYNIEYSEEYLYNFDADDNYGQTVYEGMEWGLEGITLSYDHEALFFASYTQSGLGDLIVNIAKGDTPIYYDFYVKSHDEARLDPRQVTLHEHAGYDFCTEIIQTVNGGQKDAEGNAYDTDSSNDINILQLDQQPKSAIEYCFNKNKRDNKGQVVWQNTDGTYNQSQLNWYLPAIDEIEEIVTSSYSTGQHTYARFLEFQEQDYWSCQPAYIQNYAFVSWLWGVFKYYGNFYFDDIGDTRFDINNNTDRAHIGSARSTSVSYDGEYTPTPSGTDGFYSYYNANDNTYAYSGTFNNVNIGTIEREVGNQPRNVKNRIRCVRKQ